MGTAWNIKMYYFTNKKKKRKGKKMYVAQQKVWLRKKEFFKSIAKQTDAFTVLNFGLNELKNLGLWNRIEKFRILVRQGGM